MTLTSCRGSVWRFARTSGPLGAKAQARIRDFALTRLHPAPLIVHHSATTNLSNPMSQPASRKRRLEEAPRSHKRRRGKSDTPSLSELLSPRFAPIQDSLIRELSNLDRVDIIRLQQTASCFRQLKHLLKPDINTYLAEFFHDPREFRSLQAELGFLISGPNVLQFFRRGDPVPDMVIYTEERHQHRIHDYIERRSKGYAWHFSHFAPGPAGTTGSYYNIKEVSVGKIRFAAPRLNVFWSSNNPVHEVLNAAYYTASLNFISWNKAYSLYPYTTFVKKEAYMLKPLEEQHFPEDELEKLTPYGITPKSIHWLNEGDVPQLTRPRRLNDKHTWILRLDTEGVVRSNVPDTVLESTTFKLDVVNDPGNPLVEGTWGMSHYGMNAGTILSSLALKHQYVLRTYPRSYHEKVQQLKVRIHDQCIIECMKMDGSSRPLDYINILNRSMDAQDTRPRSDLSSDWKFYDNDVLEYLAGLAKEEEAQATSPPKGTAKEESPSAHRNALSAEETSRMEVLSAMNQVMLASARR